MSQFVCCSGARSLPWKGAPNLDPQRLPALPSRAGSERHYSKLRPYRGERMSPRSISTQLAPTLRIE